MESTIREEKNTGFFSNQLIQLKDQLFSRVHKNNLIYNTCWEDPRIDRALLDIQNDSKMVMITSAGCNALDYALDKPSSIHCIDVNYRQNALLELKLVIIKKFSFDTLFQLFGEGNLNEVEIFYHEKIRQHLSLESQKFWDDKIRYFSPYHRKGSFYFRGTAGTFAHLFNTYLATKKNAKKLATTLLEAKSIEKQKLIYKELEPKILSSFVKWMMNRQSTMSLLGVPHAQRELIVQKYPEGMYGFLKDNLSHIFSELPIEDNYFWRLYITGKYTKDCCPNYLKEENFEELKAFNGIHTHTTSISNFLIENPDQYTHYILLDHQDWMAHAKPELLVEEWQLILKNSKPGTKILMRSAASEINFLPSFVTEKVDFISNKENVDALHRFDRVGTYGCTYLVTVK